MSAMTRTCWILTFIMILTGASCSEQPAPFRTADRTPKADRDAPFNPPETYPEWAYDAEHYTKPVEELMPEPRVRPTDPLHYFTRNKVVMIRQPSCYTPEEIPRVAVWWTDDNGFHWQKAGYLGRQQSHFPFDAPEDGDYGIRFVGPGQAAADPVPAIPERVYHVDTSIPEVEVKVDPEQSWYHVGQTVEISWRASDAHLVAYPVKIGVLPDFSAKKRDMAELQRELADEGTISYKIPAEALDQELRIRVDALDRAGNLGTAVSYALQVVGAEAGEETKAAAAAPDQDADRGSIETVAAEGEPVGAASDNREDRDMVEALAVAADADSNEGDGNLFDWDGPFFNGTPLTPIDPVGETTALQGPPEDSSTPPAVGSADEGDRRGRCEEDEPLPTAAAHPRLPSAELEQSTRETVVEAVVVLDPTHGNGLLIPLPATVEPEQTEKNTLATAHPWRMLGVVFPTSLRGVWGLPEPRRSLELYRKVEARFLADHARLRPAGEAGGMDWGFAGGVLPNPSHPQQIGEP